MYFKVRVLKKCQFLNFLSFLQDGFFFRVKIFFYEISYDENYKNKKKIQHFKKFLYFVTPWSFKLCAPISAQRWSFEKKNFLFFRLWP